MKTDQRSESKAVVKAVISILSPTTRKKITESRITYSNLKGQRLGQFIVNNFYKQKACTESQLIYNTTHEQAIWEGLYS